jgi:MFS family permease
VIARYRALFSVPGVGRLLVGSILGRLPSGMFSLAILLFVHGRTNSFLAAGVAVGAFTLAGAVVGPLLGSLVDRHGQTPVLLPAAAAQAALLVALVFVGQSHLPVEALVAVAALAGAALPPIAGCVRALWPEIVVGEQLDTAYALDATTQETIWTFGPMLVGLTATFVSPAAGVLLCAAITLCGTAYFATFSFSRSWHASPRRRVWAGALRGGGDLRVLLWTVVFAGGVIGAVEVGLPALAVDAGARLSSGPLLALFSVGSMAGGVAYSAKRWTMPIGKRYAAMLAAMAVAVAPLIVVHSVTAAYGLAVLAGLALAPMISCQFSLVGALAPAGTVTEAFTWHRAATVAGMAGGSALGGSLVDARGASSAFALGCVSVAAAAALAFLARRRIEPAAPAARREALSSVARVLSTPRSLRPSLACPANAVGAVSVAERVEAVPAGEVLPFTIAAEAVALAAEAVAFAAVSPDGSAERPRPFRLAAAAVALAAEAVSQAVPA